ncbi:MAG: hypothetical protein IK083_09560 [Abditibacteriota bacterium]|nr:hypothetical protein [Abditibacteriota bacterium]
MNKKTITINDGFEYNRKLLLKKRAEYIHRLETDPAFVKEKKESSAWPEIYAVIKKEGIKLAGEDD